MKKNPQTSVEDTEKFVKNTSPENLGSIVIELEQNGEIARRVTIGGNYDFSGLMPGKWHYKLYSESPSPKILQFFSLKVKPSQLSKPDP